ncbi:membrane protein insertase YidC [Luteolibacter ambystomatis]|uniref:Membrane protein insertase YidC n=1 Tax=Luteolibacter ambystomatis TaxID=2824561 RepID=A0A975J1I8_9BACT|nr:membrane protein insertase YidC [Luteolibacter ambystomatis]QUE52320.1 membrane protein insertase YidC [Luteolibacter ambystomatis]
MYDRKTWIILTACCVLLAANLYFQPKPPPAETQNQAAGQNSAAPGTPGLAVQPAPSPEAEEQTLTIETDKAVFTFSTYGGGLKFVDLKEQFAVGSKTERIRLNRNAPAPMAALAGSDQVSGNVVYHFVEQESLPGKKVVFSTNYPNGLVAKKVFSIIENGQPGSPYLIDFNLQLQNTSGQPVSLADYSLFLGEAAPVHAHEPFPASYFWLNDGDIKTDDTGKFKGGWFSGAPKSVVMEDAPKLEYAGVADQFFTTLIRPKDVQASKLWLRSKDVKIGDKELKSIYGGFSLPAVSMASNETKAFGYTIFAGPRHNAMLRQMGGNWSDIMPYSVFGWVANPLNRLLNWFHYAFRNTGPQWAWGLAIIALTLTVRTAIWPLYAKSTRSMKRMSKLQPEMAKLKEKYADDPNRMNQEMMKLYRTYGVNPLGGCLPMLIQIPIFYGFFRVLQYAVELRGQGFLWVHDLSQPDTQWMIPIFGGIPLNPLPIVMGLTSFIQIAMTPKTGDKTQQRMMMMMPFIFFFFCYNFASALALYWTTTNLFSIMQTWITNKMPEPELKEKKAVPGKKTFMERMVEKQQEMERIQRARQQGIDPGSEPPKKKRPPRTGG